MKILEFKQRVGLDEVTQLEKAKLLCYYNFKECGQDNIDMSKINSLFSDAGYGKINTSRVRKSLLADKVLRAVKGTAGALEFIPATLQVLEESHGKLWEDTETIESNSEVIDEIKFCGKRGYLTCLIQQINSSYKNHCYDACAVLMRRLFEVLLILAYQHLGIDNQIKNGDNYMMLNGIVKNAKDNPVLKLSRIKKDLDSFREVGNNSAHSITYIAGKKDIDDIKRKYRVMLEDLYNKSGLLV